MSDVLFRYLLTARRRERSAFRRLVLADDPLLEAGIEQLVETAAARVVVKSEHERIGRRRVTVPESRHHSVHFYDVARPNRPRDGHFEQRAEEFPIRDTLKVYTCPSCGGSGRVRCGSCSGRGNVGCSSCGGSGRVQTHSGRRATCGSCGGSGRRTCFSCHGSGRVTCGKCRGEGRLASWEVEVYKWLIEERSGDEYPLSAEQGRVRKAFDRWLAIDPEHLASFEPAAVADHLGFETPEALEVAVRADDHRRRLEDEARKSEDQYLFHRSTRSVAPVGYTVVRLDDRARFYWLVGRGEQAREVTPWGRPDGWKCLGWMGMGSGSLMGYESLAQVYQHALPVLESLQLFGEVPAFLLAGGSASSWLLALAGVRRIRLRKPPVPTVGLICAAGRPTAFLTCLAYLGSYLEHLRVLDRAYDLQSQRLLGEARSSRQSEGLGIGLPDGPKVRLVEVANPGNLTPEKIQLMAQVLDAVLILEEPGRKATDLKVSLAAAPGPSPRIGALTIDDERQDLGEAGAALSLEAVRRAFVEDMASDVDWQDLFDRMWRPLEELLGPPGKRRR